MADEATMKPGSAVPEIAFMKIVVSDLDRALGFYQMLLSREVTGIFEPPGAIEKLLGAPAGDPGASIILYQPTDGREIRLGNGWGPIGLRVDDVDAWYRRALDNGGKPSREPRDIGALRVAFVLDPEGHEIELISRA